MTASSARRLPVVVIGSFLSISAGLVSLARLSAQTVAFWCAGITLAVLYAAAATLMVAYSRRVSREERSLGEKSALGAYLGAPDAEGMP